jgi:TonB family protein
MSFFSNAQGTSVRYGKYIAEFQELFRKHEVSFGSPQDFFQLAPKLAYDDKFRADFSELTKSIGQREEGRLTLTRILTIIAIAMGGEGIEELGSASAVPISLVVVFLAGVGGWSETEPAEPAGKPVRTAKTSEELEGLTLEQRLAETKDFEGLTASLFGEPAMVREALSRLEMNTLALKVHLDSIDSRMERIEPHLEDLTSRFTTRVNGDGKPRAEAKAPLPVQRYSQPEMMAVPEEARPAVLPKPPGFSDEERMRGVVTLLGVLLLALAGAAAVLLYMNQVRHLREEERSRYAGATVGGAGKSRPVEAAGARGPGPPGKPGAVRRNVQPQVSQDASTQPAGARGVQGEQKSTDDQSAGSANVPAKIHLAKQKDEPPVVASGSGLRMGEGLPGGIGAGGGSRPAVSVAAVSPSVGAGLAKPASGGAAVPIALPTKTATPLKTPTPQDPVFVPSDTLAHNMISAPKPIYPPMARFQKEEGNVILQALISEAGTVESVGVVSGPAALRNAAVDALRSWRYTPYLIDGRPVKVRTYVNFHFAMAR